MPRFYFHTKTEVRVTDTEGMECATALNARAQAIVMCGQMMHDTPEGFWSSRPWKVTVTDAAGLILWSIELDAVASLTGDGLA